MPRSRRWVAFNPYGVPVDPTATTQCYTNFPGSPCNANSRAYSNPIPGVWELIVESRRTSPFLDNPYRLTAAAQGVTVDPAIQTIAAPIGEATAVSWTVRNDFGPVTVTPKGIVKVAAAFDNGDETIQACNAADVAGKPLAPEVAKRLEEANLKTIKWPANGQFLGDWKEGEKIAQSGRGMTWTDQAGAANGGNCYNCHQIDKKEISFGTIGPSLYNYGKLRGVADPASPASKAVVEYTWGKIWNSKAYNACSNMPRAGHKGILTEDQVRHIVALLLDPKSPVNQ